MKHLLQFCLTWSLVLSFLLVWPLPASAAGGFPVLGILHSGHSPEALAIDTQTHLVYIAHEAPGLIVAFNPISGKIVWQRSLYDVAVDLQVDSVNHRVYVQSTRFGQSNGRLTVLDAGTGTVIDNQPTGNAEEGIALDNIRQRVYVADNENGLVNVFSLSTPAQPTLQTLPSLSAGPHPQGLGINTRLGRLYVADSQNSTVSVFDEKTSLLLTVLAVDSQPQPPLVVDENNGRVYVACAQGHALDIIDGNSNTLITHVPVLPDPEGVSFSSATNRIYVANEGDPRHAGTTITIIDAQSFQVLGTFQVGYEPDGVAVDIDLRRIYVATESSNAVVEISDSLEITLQNTATSYQADRAQKVIGLLKQASFLTFLLMLATILLATLVVLLQRWRARESPQTPPGDGSSHLNPHNPSASGKRY